MPTETLRQRVLLLIIDKLVIGAIVAAAFVFYDHIRTTDTRRYEQAQEEQQLPFRHAEYLRTILPIVVDHKNDPELRINALGALIDTDSITPESAVALCQQLLNDNIFDLKSDSIILNTTPSKTTLSTSRSSYIESTYLQNEMSKVMPNGLTSALHMYELVEDKAGDYPIGKNATAQDQHAGFAAWFWRDVALSAIRNGSDTELSKIFGSPGPFATIAALLQNVPSDNLKDLDTRNVDTLKIATALVKLSRGRNQDSFKYIRYRYESSIDTKNPDVAILLLSAMQELEIDSPDFSQMAFDHLLANSAKYEQPMADTSNFVDSGNFVLLTEKDYLIWSGGFQDVARQLQSRALTEVTRFYHSHAAEEQIRAGTNACNVDCELVEFLVHSNCTAKQPPDAEIMTGLAGLIPTSEDESAQSPNELELLIDDSKHWQQTWHSKALILKECPNTKAVDK